jgi:hypothetical protein
MKSTFQRLPIIPVRPLGQLERRIVEDQRRTNSIMLGSVGIAPAGKTPDSFELGQRSNVYSMGAQPYTNSCKTSCITSIYTYLRWSRTSFEQYPALPSTAYVSLAVLTLSIAACVG